MKRYMAVILCLLLLAQVSGCSNSISRGEAGKVQNMEMSHTDSGDEPESGQELDHIEGTEEDAVDRNQIYIEVGESTLTAFLGDNESAEALKELLADEPLTISASNYGGFEKVCSLGTELPSNDRKITARAGEICLYNGSQIVLFYGSNSWAYTRLGKISDAYESELEKVLSGEETEITLSLIPSR